MNPYKNIAITGRKGAGKSTLARWLAEQLEWDCAGFETVRYDMTSVGPLYEMKDLLTGESMPISELTDRGIQGIPSVFEGFGVALLNRAAESEAPVLLDEIGRFERGSEGFLQGISRVLDSEKRVIAVLKQEDLPHIAYIKARRDTLLVDLDAVSREEGRRILANWMKKL